MKEGTVAVAFAPAQPGQKDQEFSWVALIKHDSVQGKGNVGVEAPLKSDGTGASAAFTVEIDGKKVELVERFRLDKDAKTLICEALKSMAKARTTKPAGFCLVDLTVQPPTVEQREVDLSGPATKLKRNSIAIEAACLRRDKVAEKDEEARKFAAATK